MDLRRKETPDGNKFTLAICQAAFYRFVLRRRAFESKAKPKREQTWAYSVIRNKSKMRTRLQKVIEAPRSTDPWGIQINEQREKLSGTLNPYSRWIRREGYILDEMTRGDYRQAMSVRMGSAWAYVATMQRKKMQETTLNRSPDDSRRLTGWIGVQNRVYPRVSRLVIAPIRRDDPWDSAIGGALDKFRHTTALNSNWRKCLDRSRRRWAD